MLVANQNFTIEYLNYVPMGNYHPMPLRPYQFGSTEDAVNMVADRMHETHAGKVTPGLLRGLTGSFLSHSATPFESSVNHGWVGTRRFMFIMKVSNVDYAGMVTNSYIFGYTEYDGISQQGHPDPQLTHYINNIIDTSVYYVQSPLHGNQRVEKLSNLYNTFYHTGQETLYTQRPVDLYSTISAMDVASYIDMPTTAVNTAGLITPYSANVVTSAADNGIGSQYLSKILTGGLHAVKAKEIHLNSYQSFASDPAEKNFIEPSISENEFVRFLSRSAGNRGISPFFRFQDLQNIDNTIYDRFQLLQLIPDSKSPLLTNTPDVGAHWKGSDPVTIKAHSLLENCVALVTKYGFSKMSFRASNREDTMGSIQVGVLDFSSFMNLPQEQHNYLLEIFKDSFIVDVFMSETGMVGATAIPLYMECHVNLFGATKLYLEWAGMPGAWYTLPTFANSLYHSVLTVDQNVMDFSAQSLRNVLDSLLQTQPQQTF